MLPAQPNQSLIDGLSVLQALAVSTEPVGGRALARQLGLEPTRVNRLLKTLAYLGMARQTPNRKYLPGPAMHVLSAQSLFGSGLIRRALPVLESLQRYGHVVALGVLWRDQVCYLYHWEKGETSATALGRMNLYPASQSSIGRVLLAWQDEGHVRNLYQGKEIPLYPGGVDDLLKDLRDVRQQRYAYAVQRPHPLNASVAVPTSETHHAALAFGGAVPAQDVPDLVQALRAAADQIENANAPVASSRPSR
jgi:DNA-binding IclR family transcriptional regulator